MADYYPVLKRAISSLPSGSGDARRAVYEKARAALLRQLNSYNPPLSPEDISNQRLALEECIRRVEAEVAEGTYARSDAPAAAGAAPAPSTPPPPPSRPAEPPLSTPRSYPPRDEAAPPIPVMVRTPPQPRAETERPPLAKAPEDRSEPRIVAGISALSKTLRQAGALGEASSTAVKAARTAIDDEQPAERSPQPTLPHDEPPLDIRHGYGVAPEEAADEAAAAEPAPAVDALKAREPIASVPWPTREKESRSSSRIVIAIAAIVIVAAAALGAVMLRDDIAQLVGVAVAPTPAATPVGVEANGGLDAKNLDRLPIDGVEAEPVAPDAHSVQTEQVAAAPQIDPDLPPPPSGTSAPAAPAAGSDLPATVPTTPAIPDAAVAPPPAAVTAAPADNGSVLVAQKAIVYEEPIPGSPGSKMEGTVVWSFINEAPLPGEKPIPQIRALIEIPDLKLSLKLSIHKNDDQALPASHIAELNFTVPPSFPGRSIDMTPGMIAKQTEEARGDPIVGAVAKVSDSIYWLALSGLPQDVERNIALMKTREWIDVPIRYGNRRRAILTFEKGVPGNKVIADAFAAWGQ